MRLKTRFEGYWVFSFVSPLMPKKRDPRTKTVPLSEIRLGSVPVTERVKTEQVLRSVFRNYRWTMHAWCAGVYSRSTYAYCHFVNCGAEILCYYWICDTKIRFLCYFLVFYYHRKKSNPLCSEIKLTTFVNICQNNSFRFF